MFGFLVVLYVVVMLFFLIGCGVVFETETTNERRLAASMMLLCWAWPVFGVMFLLYGIYKLMRAAIGRE